MDNKLCYISVWLPYEQPYCSTSNYTFITGSEHYTSTCAEYAIIDGISKSINNIYVLSV